jgi:competence protein ComEC
MSAPALQGVEGRGLDPGWRAALCALAWLAGLAWQLQQARLWPVVWYGGLAVACGLWLLTAIAWRRARVLAACLLAAAGLAVAMAGLRADARLAERLAPALEGRNLLVTGVVANLPQRGPSGLRFLFEVDRAEWQDVAPGRVGVGVGVGVGGSAPGVAAGAAPVLPPLLSLGWYNNFSDEVALDDPRNSLQAGQRWRLPLRLKQPHGTLNPDGFDVELLWFEQGVGATGYVRVARGGAPADYLGDAAGHPVQGLREAVRQAIARQVSDPRLAGVLAALAVGDQAGIEREDWDLFRRTGIAHLVSISGVHVTMFAWAAGALASRLWRRSPWLMLRLPASMAGRWLGLALATAYAVLAGWGVPAQRTVIMLVTTGLLRSGGQRWPWPLVLLAAAVVVTLFDPWALLQPGFWLSFSAVGLLMVSGPADSQAGAAAMADPPDADPVPPTAGWRDSAFGRLFSRFFGRFFERLQDHLGGHVQGHLRAQLVATFGLAPLSVVFFQQLSLVGGLANLVAIPLVTLLITPLALLGMLLPWAWTLAAAAVQAMVWGLGLLAQWPWAVYQAPAAPAWAVACGLLGAVLGLLPVPWALRWLALPLVLPLLWPPLARPAPGGFEVLAADIGQGTAVLVRTQNHLLVYDTGPQYSLDNDAGLRVLLPLLGARGERRIDLLVLSHRDGDHVGGAASLLAGRPVAALQSSLEPGHALLAQAARLGVPTSRCDAGQRWTWDGVAFEWLHPTPQEHAAARKSNALSCVLRIADAQGHSVLLTGDIEAPQEAALLQRQSAGNGPTLASTVLLVPHHGSRTSSSAEFIDAVQPRTAVVQAGYRSRYGHPAPDVIRRYTNRGIEVVRSDQCGAWLWHDGAGVCTREVRRRYWHWTAPEGGAIVAIP